MCLFALPPVKYFDVFGDGLNGLGAGLEAPVVTNSFLSNPQAFHGGVVVAASPARHRWHHAKLIEQFSVLMNARPDPDGPSKLHVYIERRIAASDLGRK